MENIIEFMLKGSDPFFRITTNYQSKIGDVVFYELKADEKDYKDIVKLNNGNLELEGVISDKWVNLSENYIIWSVEIY